MSGKIDKDEHLLNMHSISVILEVSHLDKSGKYNKDEHLLKIEFIV